MRAPLPSASPPPAATSADIVAAISRVVAPPAALHEPEIAGSEWDYVKDCLDSGWVSSVGSFVDRFEGMLSEVTGAHSAVATVNGTAALHACLILAGVRPGDEVIVPTLTFVGTANAVSYAGATPHFADSEERTLGLDADKLADHLRDIAETRDGVPHNRLTGRPLRAAVTVHLFGHPAEVEAIAEVCRRHSLVFVEDAAESLGSTRRGRHTGTFGRLGALSFNGNKIVTTGGGGAVLTDDADLGRAARHLTTTAKRPHAFAYEHDRVGYNYRLPNLNAAMGCAQLERLPDMLTRKRMLAGRYQQALAGLTGLRVFREPEGCRSNYWLNAIVLDAPDRAHRDAILAAATAAGFMCRPAWTPMHRLPMYADCPRMELGTAEALFERIVNLPSSARLGARA